MEIRYSSHPEDVKYYTTEELRDHFLITDLFQYGEIKSVYYHEDRMIVGSAMPTTAALAPEDGRHARILWKGGRWEFSISAAKGLLRQTAPSIAYSTAMRSTSVWGQRSSLFPARIRPTRQNSILSRFQRTSPMNALRFQRPKPLYSGRGARLNVIRGRSFSIFTPPSAKAVSF